MPFDPSCENIAIVSWLSIWISANLSLLIYATVALMTTNGTSNDFIRYSVIGMTGVHILVSLGTIISICKKGFCCHTYMFGALYASWKSMMCVAQLQSLINVGCAIMGISLIITQGLDTYEIEKLSLICIPCWGLLVVILGACFSIKTYEPIERIPLFTSVIICGQCKSTYRDAPHKCVHCNKHLCVPCSARSCPSCYRTCCPECREYIEKDIQFWIGRVTVYTCGTINRDPNRFSGCAIM